MCVQNRFQMPPKASDKSRVAAIDCSPTRKRGAYGTPQSPAPEERKIFATNLTLTSLEAARYRACASRRGWMPKQLISTGSRPWLQSVAAPRLGTS
jgi:hypothetical protein